MPQPPRTTGSKRDLPTLSCQACAERKVRCNRQIPCSTCESTGVVCIPVQRRRLPRGRLHFAQAAENKELRERLANLEALVAANSAAWTPPASSIARSSTPSIVTAPSEGSHNAISPQPAITVPLRAPSRYLADGFWEDLANKEPRLGELLSDDSSGSTDSTSYGLGSVLGFGSAHSAQSYVNAALALRPSANVSKKMCHVYLERVDSILRVFHRPSLIGFLVEDKGYLNYPESHPVLDALRASIFLMTVVSMAEDQCRPMFGSDRATLISTYRSACEVALDRVSLHTTEDITVLQSFVLYLFALKSYDRSRTAWTLCSLAVRIATALRINQDRYNIGRSFFDQQMRSRLWHTICLLDAHLSFERVSSPLISHHTEQPALPLNINDVDFTPNTTNKPAEITGLTDMCVALRLYHTQRLGRALGTLNESSPQQTPQDSAAVASRKLQLIAEFEIIVNSLLQGCDPDKSTFAWIVHQGAQATIIAMRLFIHRPIHSKEQPEDRAAFKPMELLRLAVQVLHNELVMQSDPRGEPYRWYGILHWQPLAIAIFESYGCEDVAVLRDVWPTIEEAYEHLGTPLAEYRQGTLWEPMKRLMSKTRERVNGVLAQGIRLACKDQEIIDSKTAAEHQPWTDVVPPVSDLGWGSWDQFISDFTFDGPIDWLPDADLAVGLG